jgi:predicted transcriptional regulator
MFQPTYQDIAFDEILNYLKDNGESVDYTTFTNHVCGLYEVEGYTFMKRLKEKDLINYNEHHSSVPIKITKVGLDFITRTSFVNEAKKLYDKEQNLLNQTVSVGTNYGQINAGHQSSFDNSDQTFSTSIPTNSESTTKKSSLSVKTLKYIGDNIIVRVIVGIIIIYLAIKIGLKSK